MLSTQKFELFNLLCFFVIDVRKQEQMWKLPGAPYSKRGLLTLCQMWRIFPCTSPTNANANASCENCHYSCNAKYGESFPPLDMTSHLHILPWSNTVWNSEYSFATPRLLKLIALHNFLWQQTKDFRAVCFFLSSELLCAWSGSDVCISLLPATIA